MNTFHLVHYTPPQEWNAVVADVIGDAWPLPPEGWVVRMQTEDGRFGGAWPFRTREFAQIFKDLCERLEQIRFDHAHGYAAGRWVVRSEALIAFNVGPSVVGHKLASVDDLAFKALVARWTAPLRAKLRRGYELLMWGERGRV